MDFVKVGLTLAVSWSLLAATSAQAQEPEWLLEIGDPTGDVIDVSAERDGPQPSGPAYIDITALRIEVDGDDLLAAYEVAESIPEPWAPGLDYEYALLIERDGRQDLVAWVYPGKVWRAEVSDGRALGKPRMGTADYEGNVVTIRLPMSLLGSPEDLRFAAVTRARGAITPPGALQLGDGEPGNSFDPDSLFRSLLDLDPDTLDDMLGSVSEWTDRVPAPVGDMMSFPPATGSVLESRIIRNATFAKAQRTLSRLLAGESTGSPYGALAAAADDAPSADDISVALASCARSGVNVKRVECPAVAAELFWLSRRLELVSQGGRMQLLRVARLVRSASINAGVGRKGFDRRFLAAVSSLGESASSE